MSSDYYTLAFDDPRYPARLREIHSAPATLYVRGNFAALNDPQIAVVGCRRMSAYGSENAFQFSKALAEIGITITSGLAMGIDTMAHQGALAAKGQTIAVLGTGLNNIYPSQNKKLASDIIEQGGAIISELPLDAEPFPYHFPRRNRIISALSLGVLVIEAAEKSGSLITARFALEQNREIFAIPGSIHSATSKGCHQLIKEGATLVESISDLLVQVQEKLKQALLLPIASQGIPAKSGKLQSQKKHDTPIKKNTHPLLEFLSIEESTPLDILVARTGASIENLNADLLLLELSGEIAKVAGGYVLK